MLLAVSSEPHDGGTLAVGWQWLLLGMCVPLAGLGAIGLRLTGTWSAVLLAFASGLSFACVAVSARCLDLRTPCCRPRSAS